MIGNGDNEYSCRIRQRREGDPTATATSIYSTIGNVYAPINGNTNIDAPYMNNVYVTAPTGNQNSEWTLDLKKDVNVKKVNACVCIAFTARCRRVVSWSGSTLTV